MTLRFTETAVLGQAVGSRVLFNTSGVILPDQVMFVSDGSAVIGITTGAGEERIYCQALNPGNHPEAFAVLLVDADGGKHNLFFDGPTDPNACDSNFLAEFIPSRARQTLFGGTSTRKRLFTLNTDPNGTLTVSDVRATHIEIYLRKPVGKREGAVVYGPAHLIARLKIYSAEEWARLIIDGGELTERPD